MGLLCLTLFFASFSIAHQLGAPCVLGPSFPQFFSPYVTKDGFTTGEPQPKGRGEDPISAVGLGGDFLPPYFGWGVTKVRQPVSAETCTILILHDRFCATIWTNMFYLKLNPPPPPHVQKVQCAERSPSARM